MATNTKRRVVFTIELEADGHDSEPLSNVLELLEDDISADLASHLEDTVRDAIVDSIKDVQGIDDVLEEAVISTISSEGWTIQECSWEVKSVD